MPADEANNYLGAEALILARLKARLEGRVATYGTMADMQAVEEMAQRTPAVYVVFDGFNPTRTTGRATETEQRWLVVVAVRNVRGTHTGAAAREDAGELLADLIPALQNWRPGPGHTPLRMSNPPAPVYREGFAYVPTAWTTNVITTQTED